MNAIDKADIQRKEEKLRACAAYLKEEFIGIDNIIDELIDYLRLWYLMPGLLTRPIIINLWGMTGVGKTDLVRKLVKFLDYQDRFAEIEMRSADSSHYSMAINGVLTDYKFDNGEPGIVLFDEIQRFSTVNPDGSPIKQNQYVDFWELLSDGRLSRGSNDEYDNQLFEYFYNRKRREKQRARGEEVQEREGELSSWDAMQLQRNLGLNLSFNELIDLNEEKMIELILDEKRKKRIYEPIDYSKVLIIISGNLDEAFTMARQTSEADIDADIYHAFTKKITLVDIKNALARKFRPEQVARFGNIHLIYHSLRSQDFARLIKREIDQRTARIHERFGITVEVDEAVERLIYRNGVFPVQGVRPVFSSIIDILETNWNKYIFEALMTEQDHVAISYDEDELALVVTIGGGETRRLPYKGRIDKIRQADKPDVVAGISVHEAGHAVVYMLTTGMVPLQLKSKIASSYAAGFTYPHDVYATKRSILDRIRVYLAGGLAEEIVFGEEHASTGRAHDREQATAIAVGYVRAYGFDPQFQAVYNLSREEDRLDMTKTDQAIESIMQSLVADTRGLLEQHRDLLLDLSRRLNAAGSLEGKAVETIARQHGLDVSIGKKGDTVVTNYADRLHEA